MTPMQFRVTDVTCRERFVKFRMPFRYGILTLHGAPEIEVTVQIETTDGQTSYGTSAELLAPKWFDKSPDLTNEQNFEQLRLSVDLAKAAYLKAEAGAAFQIHANLEADIHKAALDKDLPGLVAGYGIAVLDRAIIDALCRLQNVSFEDFANRNGFGLSAATAPDLDGFDFDAFLGGLSMAKTIMCRHTVGLTDYLTDAEIKDEHKVNDGRPESLEGAVRTFGIRAFKLKICGDEAADIDRLERIAEVIDKSPDAYLVSLDGNEQYKDAASFSGFLDAMRASTRLTRMFDAIKYIEQPIARSAALSVPIHALAQQFAIEIDESDGDVAAFAEAREMGYSGVSSKSCKGVYRSLINRARVEKWNAEAGSDDYFMSAEDLSTQVGICLQQDLSLASLIGCTHIERNGYQYGDGLSGGSAAWREQLAKDHPDLYEINKNRLEVKIENGEISLASLTGVGFGVRTYLADDG